MADLLRDARERLLCKGNDCETPCPRCILSFDLRYRSRDLYRHKGLEVLTPAWLSLLDLPEKAPSSALRPPRKPCVSKNPYCPPPASSRKNHLSASQSAFFMDARRRRHTAPSGDTAAAADALELVLKKERHESFSQNEYKELVLEAREVMKSWQEKNLPLMQQFGMG